MLQHLHIFLEFRGPELNTGTEGIVSPVGVQRDNQSRNLHSHNCFWHEPGCHCLLGHLGTHTGSCLAASTPRSSSSRQLSSHSAPSLWSGMGLFWTEGSTQHITLLTPTPLLLAHWSSLYRSRYTPLCLSVDEHSNSNAIFIAHYRCIHLLYIYFTVFMNPVFLSLPTYRIPSGFRGGINL